MENCKEKINEFDYFKEILKFILHKDVYETISKLEGIQELFFASLGANEKIHYDYNGMKNFNSITFKIDLPEKYEPIIRISKSVHNFYLLSNKQDITMSDLKFVSFISNIFLKKFITAPRNYFLADRISKIRNKDEMNKSIKLLKLFFENFDYKKEDHVKQIFYLIKITNPNSYKSNEEKNLKFLDILINFFEKAQNNINENDIKIFIDNTCETFDNNQLDESSIEKIININNLNIDDKNTLITNIIEATIDLMKKNCKEIYDIPKSQSPSSSIQTKLEQKSNEVIENKNKQSPKKLIAPTKTKYNRSSDLNNMRILQ